MTSSSLRAPVLVLTALLAVPVLAACSDSGPSPRQAAEPVPIATTSSASAPRASTTSASAATTAQPVAAQATPSSTKVVLFGDQLGPAKVGDPFREAVTALSAVLGPPTADPTDDVACAHADSEVAWGDFRIAEGQDGTVAGWASTSRTLSSPSGVRVGTPLSTLRRVYGAKLDLVDGPGAFREFGVRGVSFAGALSSASTSATVTSLYNGVCGSP